MGPGGPTLRSRATWAEDTLSPKDKETTRPPPELASGMCSLGWRPDGQGKNISPPPRLHCHSLWFLGPSPRQKFPKAYEIGVIIIPLRGSERATPLPKVAQSVNTRALSEMKPGLFLPRCTVSFAGSYKPTNRKPGPHWRTWERLLPWRTQEPPSSCGRVSERPENSRICANEKEGDW